MRFGYVTEQIAIGGVPGSQEVYDQMQRWLGGITHIICLTELCEHNYDNIHNAEILHFYLSDDGKQKPNRYWATCVEYALGVLKHKDNRLLIHCAAGRNRSTSIAYAVLRCIGYKAENAEEIILRNYADKMHEQEKHLNNPGAYRRLKSIRYKDQVDLWFDSVWSKK